MRKREKGFTLIELMLSILIVSVATAGALEAIYMSNRLSIQAKENTIALSDARAIVDRIKITPLSMLPSNGSTVNASTIWSNLNDFVSMGLVNENIYITGGAGSSVRQITIAVSWSGVGNRNRQLKFTTLKSSFNG